MRRQASAPNWIDIWRPERLSIILPCMKNDTRVIHPPAVDVPADNRALVAPIYQSVKFSFDDAGETLRYLRGEREGFFYSRSSNPTLKQLQLLLAQLQGRDDCLLTGSGVATIAASLLSLCKQDDHVLAFVESYGPTRYIVQHLLAKFGVAHTLLSIEDLEGIERVLQRYSDSSGDIREPHQPGHQDRRHRTSDGVRPPCRARSPCSTTPSPVFTTTAPTTSTFSCTA